MKISNADICKMLNKQDGQNWELCFKGRKVFFQASSIGSSTDYSKQTCISIAYYLPNLMISDKTLRDLFINLDWNEAYEKSIVIKKLKANEWRPEKVFISDIKDFHFSMTIPKRIEKLLKNFIEKTNEGKGGK